MARGGRREGAGRPKGSRSVKRAAATIRAARRSPENQITAARVLQELARIGFADIRKIVQWRANVTEIGADPVTGEAKLRGFNEVVVLDSAAIDDGTAAAIAEISQTRDGAIKVKLHDKRAALALIGQHLGLFRQAAPVKAPDAPGKKEEATKAAETAEQGTGWSTLLN